jgi:hypothetical protein
MCNFSYSRAAPHRLIVSEKIRIMFTLQKIYPFEMPYMHIAISALCASMPSLPLGKVHALSGLFTLCAEINKQLVRNLKNILQSPV